MVQAWYNLLEGMTVLVMMCNPPTAFDLILYYIKTLLSYTLNSIVSISDYGIKTMYQFCCYD